MRQIFYPGILVMMIALASVGQRATGQQSTTDQRSDKVNNTIIIDNKIVVKQRLSAEQSGIRLNAMPASPETFAKDQAIESHVTGDVQQVVTPPATVKGTMDNIVDVKNIITSADNDDSKACIEIGTVRNDDACKPKKGRRGR
jgi:hypothetical protein